MSDICRVCKQPLGAHALIMRGGVAHTIVYLGNERSICSAADADRSYLVGEITRLMTVIRSLRWRAGRMRNRDGSTCVVATLNGYSDKIARDRNRLIDVLNQYYSWGK